MSTGGTPDRSAPLALKKSGYVLLVGGWWTFFVILVTTFMELWPDGKKIGFGAFFLYLILVYALGFFLFYPLLLTFMECARGKTARTGQESPMPGGQLARGRARIFLTFIASGLAAFLVLVFLFGLLAYITIMQLELRPPA